MAFDIKKHEIAKALDAMRILKVRGGNVTMPNKKEVVKLVDKITPAARLVGAINTVTNANGVITGYNTDGEGFVKNLLNNDVPVEGTTVTLLGSGGAGLAITAQLALDGVKNLMIFNRKDDFYGPAEELAKRGMQEVPACNITVTDLDDQEALRAAIKKSQILVNSTGVGMAPDIEGTNIKDTSMFRPDLVVADTVYNPGQTRMLLEAQAAGVKKTINGDGMMLWQGVANFKLYIGQDMPVEEVASLFDIKLSPKVTN